MATTPVYGLRYQGLNDAPDGADLGADLAADVEDELVRIDAGAVGLAALLNNAFSAASVATQQTTSSAAFVDLATVGPAVTRTTGNNALVIVSCFLFNATIGAVSSMGHAVSGATTVAATDVSALALHSQIANGQGRLSRVFQHTGLTPGSNTFTAKYRVNAGTGNFADRQLIVLSF